MTPRRRPWCHTQWGVEFTNSRAEALLLGSLWDAGEFARWQRGDMRASEPTRALLFCRRAQAREWCAAKNAEWREHSDAIVKAWRVRPVRVRETVQVLA